MNNKTITGLEQKHFTLKKSETKLEDYNIYIYLYANELENIGEFDIIKPSVDVIKTNPVVFIETRNIDGNLVFVYKKMDTSAALRQLKSGIIIGSILRFV